MEDVNKLFFNHAVSKVVSDDFDLNSAILSVDSAMRINGQCGFIIDFDEHKILYRSEQMFYVDEATYNDVKRDCANPYWSLVSDETLAILLQIRNAYPPISELLPVEEYSKHVCIIDYPINIRGHKLYISQKFTPLQMRSDGITKVGLFTINPSNKLNTECMIIAPDGRRFRFDLTWNKFVEFNLGKTLTVTEKAILFRAKMGMTNEEIANNLYLSVHTIKTHRVRIFKKLNVNSIGEALTVIGNYHLL